MRPGGVEAAHRSRQNGRTKRGGLPEKYIREGASLVGAHERIQGLLRLVMALQVNQLATLGGTPAANVAFAFAFAVPWHTPPPEVQSAKCKVQSYSMKTLHFAFYILP